MSRLNKVAQYFLSRESMTSKKLQKLVYYAYGWTLALLNDSVQDIEYRLFPNQIEAWVHGPVIPDLYQEYKSYGWKDIPQSAFFDIDAFSSDEVDILGQVWQVYGNYTANQLEMISHQEAPWINARKGIPAGIASSNLIKDSDIYMFFNEQAA